MMRIRVRASPSPLPIGRGEPLQPLLWVAALAVYLAVLGGLGLVVLRDAARSWEASLAGTMTLQVPADASTARLNTVLALLRQTRGIVSVHLFEPGETSRLIAPWLGPSIALDRLPVPRIVDLRVDGSAMPDVADLRIKLASLVPEAVLEQSAPLVQDLRRTADLAAAAGAAIIAAVFPIMIWSAASTARTGLLVHRELIDLLHQLGADDAYILGRFQMAALRLALLGGLAGAAAAALTILAAGGIGTALQLPIPPDSVEFADWRVWVIFVGAVIVVSALTMITARIAVLRRLAHMP